MKFYVFLSAVQSRIKGHQLLVYSWLINISSYMQDTKLEVKGHNRESRGHDFRLFTV